MIGSKLDKCKEEFEKLFNQGLSDYKIAKVLGMNHATIFQWRKKHGYVRENMRFAKANPVTEDNLEVLVGTLLGDSCLRIDKNGTNPRFSCEHGIKQKEYCEYKASMLLNLGAKCHYSKRQTIDKRTGIYYESYSFRLPANPSLFPLYNAFYKNGKKVIPLDYLKYFTAKSLALMFMDDGFKMQNGYCIATNCFTEEDIKAFRLFLLDKFDLETSMFSSHVIYIHKKSTKHFEDLIKPYMHNSMLYKLITVS